jgi:hypothetical protein
MSCGVTFLVGVHHNWEISSFFLSGARSRNEGQTNIAFANALLT